jgi:LCP family protein required for cell wall assembly
MKRTKTLSWLLFCCLLAAAFCPTTASAAPQQNGICNGPDEVMTILVVGTDTRSVGYLYGMADTVMVFRIDFQNQEVAVMGVPRGIWVMIPDVEEDNGRTHGKLTQAYHFGTEGMGYYSGEGYGAGLLQETFRYNWNFDINKFIVINMRTFRDVIDVIGGIKVYNPSPLYTFHKPNQPIMPIGGYYFSGPDALLYARYRDPRNMYDRVARQEIVLKAIYDQVFSLSTIPKIPEIFGLYKRNVLTDLSLAELSQLACLAAKTDPDDVIFTRIPKDLLYIPDWESSPWLEKEPGSIEKVLDDFENGIYPEQKQ